jgi:hypothetical protein
MSGVLAQTFPGSPGGMNRAFPAQEIDDTEAQYIQDALLDYPGLMRRRGPVTAHPTVAALPRPASGLAVTMNPRGSDRYAALTGNSSNGYLSTLSDDAASWVDLAWPHALPTDPAGDAATAYRLTDAKPALAGGTFIGTASDYGATDSLHALAYWKGGNKADYSTGTLSVSRGSATVTGSGTSWLANVVPGMFLFANTDDPLTDTLIGSVLSVNTDTSITLEKVSPYAITAKAYTLKSIRGFIPKVTKGRITADVNSTTVSGGQTKFSTQGLGSGTWNLYRGSDGTWIGKVASVQSDISLTLSANAAIALADEEYVALRGDWSADDKSIDITDSVNKVGWLTATYAERQWYANNGAQFDKTYRVWFSDTGDPESTDLSADGDWIPISSTSDTPEPIRQLMPTYNALLVFKESETFAIYGSSPSSFSAKKLEDDGTISAMSVQPYGGGAIWAGRDGIYFYDGVQVQNLTDPKLGDVWKNTIRSIDTLRYRAWSMVVRNHYFLFLESLDPTISVTKGNTSTTPNHWVVVVNMETRAVDLHTNVGIRGAITLPAEEGRDTWFAVNDETAGVGKIVNASSLFDDEGVDDFLTVPGGTVGPDFYWESKKFNAGDDVRLKRWKMFSMHYLAQGGDLKIDTVLGLNNVGRTLTSTFPASVYTWNTFRVAVGTWAAAANQFATWFDVIQGVFVPKRVRFTKKAHHLSIRVWQENQEMTRVRLGPFKVVYKLMREGRV